MEGWWQQQASEITIGEKNKKQKTKQKNCAAPGADFLAYCSLVTRKLSNFPEPTSMLTAVWVVSLQ